MRRIAGLAAIATGLFLFAVPFATSLFERTGRCGGEPSTQCAASSPSPGFTRARRNYGTVNAAGEELNGELSRA